jgi:hypothetical protein
MQDKSDTTITSSPTGAEKAPEAIQDFSAASGSGSTRRDSRSGAGVTGSSSTVEKAKTTISNVASHAGDKVAFGLDAQKAKAAEGLGSVARALRQSSDELREQNQGGAVPEYISSAASQVERLSGYLQSTNTKEMVNGVERFARQQPALFIGGVFLLGLLGARFLKSSAQSTSGQSAQMSRGEQFVPRDGLPETSTYGRGSSDDDSTPARRTPARTWGTH